MSISHANQHSIDQQVRGAAVRGGPALLPLQRGGLARELRALQVQPRRLLRRQLRLLRPPGACVRRGCIAIGLALRCLIYNNSPRSLVVSAKQLTPPLFHRINQHSPDFKSGPLDLHGPDVRVGRAGHRRRRLRRLPPALDGAYGTPRHATQRNDTLAR